MSNLPPNTPAANSAAAPAITNSMSSPSSAPLPCSLKEFVIPDGHTKDERCPVHGKSSTHKLGECRELARFINVERVKPSDAIALAKAFYESIRKSNNPKRQRQSLPNPNNPKRQRQSPPSPQSADSASLPQILSLYTCDLSAPAIRSSVFETDGRYCISPIDWADHCDPNRMQYPRLVSSKALFATGDSPRPYNDLIVGLLTKIMDDDTNLLNSTNPALREIKSLSMPIILGTGADINVIPRRAFELFERRGFIFSDVKPGPDSAKVPDGGTVVISYFASSRFIFTFADQQKVLDITFAIFEGDGPPAPLISRPTMDSIGLSLEWAPRVPSRDAPKKLAL